MHLERQQNLEISIGFKLNIEGREHETNYRIPS